MSLYHSLFGVNKLAPMLLGMLKLTPDEFNRFRDAYLNDDGTEIIVYTRCGGGNRDEYFPAHLTDHEQYLSDRDDDYDCTYAYINFRVPESYLEACGKLATGDTPKSIETLFAEAIDDIDKHGKDSEYFKRVAPELAPLIDILTADNPT